MKTIIIFIFIIFVNAQEINIGKHWNLLGAIEDLNGSFFRPDCADSVWIYDNNSWKNFAHSKDTISSFFTIDKGKGFWVYNKDGNCSLNTMIETWYKYTVPNVSPNVNANSKIVKKGSKFLALIDLHIPPKSIATTGSTLISSEDGINWKNMNVELPGTYF